MTATEYVVLVDEHDHEQGVAEKMEAHRNCLLHRAFSIFIFKTTSLTELNSLRDDSELLLQQRALHKYHSAGLWTNTCCSHPRRGEDILAAGKRRLQEEMGFSTALSDVGWFHYTAHFPNGLSENEIDHVLIGSISNNDLIKPNPNEVHATRWISLGELRHELATQPHLFTPWLSKALEKLNHATQ